MVRNEPKIHTDAADYNYGDDVLYPKPKPKSKRRHRDKDVSLLVALCVFSLALLGSFVALKLIPKPGLDLASFFSLAKTRDAAQKNWGMEKLGTTIDVLRARQPGALQTTSKNGSIMVSFSEDDGRYLVWYGQDGADQIAYKSRQNRIIEDTSEESYIATIAKRYGAPATSECNRAIASDQRDCQFSWWTPDEVRLDLTSRRSVKDTTANLDVTLVATDTRLEGRILRNQLSTTLKREQRP